MSLSDRAVDRLTVYELKIAREVLEAYYKDTEALEILSQDEFAAEMDGHRFSFLGPTVAQSRINLNAILSDLDFRIG